MLQDVKLNRCYKLNGLSKVISSSLQHFSDTLESSYGQLANVTLVNAAGKVYSTTNKVNQLSTSTNEVQLNASSNITCGNNEVYINFKVGISCSFINQNV